jgi:hypothetical protein
MNYLLMFLTHAEPAVVSFWPDFDTDMHATRTSSTYIFQRKSNGPTEIRPRYWFQIPVHDALAVNVGDRLVSWVIAQISCYNLGGTLNDGTIPILPYYSRAIRNTNSMGRLWEWRSHQPGDPDKFHEPELYLEKSLGSRRPDLLCKLQRWDPSILIPSSQDHWTMGLQQVLDQKFGISFLP